MPLSTAIKSASELLSSSINEGNGTAKANLGGGGTAFGWAEGTIRTVADYATVSTASGMSFATTVVSESGTPAAVVAAGGTKPTATTITSGTVALKKHAGLGISNLEAHLDATNLASVISSVLGASCLKSFEADAIAVLDAAGGTPVTGTSWVSAVAAAQAKLLGNGATPSFLTISALDYAAFVDDVLTTNAFAQSPDSPVGNLLGVPVHVSPKAPAGKAWLADASAVICVEHQSSPIGVIDAVSQAATNQMRIVIDVVATTFVPTPAGIVEITAPAAAMSAKRK